MEKLKERLTHFRVGDSLDKAVDMGAIVDESQRKSIEEYVESARQEGADVSIQDLVKKNFWAIPLKWKVSRKNQVIDKSFIDNCLLACKSINTIIRCCGSISDFPLLPTHPF